MWCNWQGFQAWLQYACGYCLQYACALPPARVVCVRACVEGESTRMTEQTRESGNESGNTRVR